MTAPLAVLARRVSTVLGRESRLIRFLRPLYDWMLHLLSAGRGISRTLNGRERFRVDPRYRVHFPESYDPVVLGWLRAQVPSGAICLNVGAHVGIYALCLADWAGPHGRVHAFEPNPTTRAVLERHVRLNHLAGRVNVVPAAVADTVGTSTFIAAGLEGYSRLGQPNPAMANLGHRITVPTTTIDAFCATQGLVPDWITIDIEGFEGAALEGAFHSLLSDRTGVVVEMHPNMWASCGWSADRMGALLAALGRRVVPLTGQRDVLADYGIIALVASEPAAS